MSRYDKLAHDKNSNEIGYVLPAEFLSVLHKYGNVTTQRFSSPLTFSEETRTYFSEFDADNAFASSGKPYSHLWTGC